MKAFRSLAAAFIFLMCSSGETVTSSSSSSSSSPKAQKKNIRKKSDRRVTGTPPELPEEPPPHIPAKGKVILRGQDATSEERLNTLAEVFPQNLHMPFSFSSSLFNYLNCNKAETPEPFCCRFRPKGAGWTQLKTFIEAAEGILKCHNILQQTKC